MENKSFSTSGQMRTFTAQDFNGSETPIDLSSVTSATLVDGGKLLLTLNGGEEMIIDGFLASELSISSNESIDLSGLNIHSIQDIYAAYQNSGYNLKVPGQMRSEADDLAALNKPDAGETETITLEQGQGYEIGFAQSEVTSIEETATDITFTFENGSTLIVIYASGESTEIASNDLQNIAEQLAELKPAGGNEASGGQNTGLGFNSDFSSSPFLSQAAIGAINPTALNYRTIEFDPERIGTPTPNATTGIQPPVLEVGGTQVKEDGSVQLVLNAEGDGSGEFLTITIENIDAGWGVDTLTSGGTYDSTTGTWTLILQAGKDFLGGPTFSPPAESDVDLTDLLVTVVATDTATGDTRTNDSTVDIIVDAVADDPSIAANGGTEIEGTPIDVDVAGTLGTDDFDGSESITGYEISGVLPGFSFNQGTDLGGGVWSFTPAQLTGLQITGPADYDGTLDLTATVFTVDTPTDSEFDTSDNTNSASTDLSVTWTPDIDPPEIEINNGVDDICVLEDAKVEVPLTVDLSANAEDGEFLTITVKGIDSSWGFSSTIGTYDPATGTWSVTLPANTNLDTVFIFAPPAESDIDLTGLVVEAIATDPDEGTSAKSSDDFDITVDAVADAPTIAANGGTANEGSPIFIDITGGLGSDQDGSESITGYEISGVLPGFSFNQGTDLGGGVWSFTPAQLTGLQITGPADYDGTLDLTVTVFSMETPTDNEWDLTNNTNSASTSITVTWNDDAPIIAPPSDLEIDETNLDDAGDLTVDGTINVEFGADGPGTFSGNDTFTFGGSATNGQLTSGGSPVTVTQTASGYTGEDGNGNIIFTLDIDPANGNHTFTLIGTLDHADGIDPNDIISLDFGFTVTDSDGDTSSNTIKINVADDGPTIAAPASSGASEVSLVNGPSVIAGTLDFDFGEDGAGELAANGDFRALFYVGGPRQEDDVTSGGEPVTVTHTVNGYVGTTSNGDVIFEFAIDTTTGNYTFTLTGTLDHPNNTTAPESIWLKFGVEVTDSDGDTVTTLIKFDIMDSVAVAHDDTNVFDAETVITTDGNVITGENGGPGAADDLSQDFDTTVTEVTFNGTTIAVDPINGATIDGDYGTLTINPDGSYTYDLFTPLPDTDTVQDTFEYTITDGDGDTSTADLDIVADLPDQADPVFIVGQNVDDVDPSVTPYEVGNGDGTIEGNTGPDILVGDVGGASSQNSTGDFNVALVLDISGSMEGSKIDLLKAAITNLVNDFGKYTGGDILVHISTFSVFAPEGFTFMVTDPAGLAAALAFIDGIDADGSLTNYEAPLAEAGAWWAGDTDTDPISGAQNFTYFVSDGSPNVYNDVNGDITPAFGSGGDALVIDEITGGDGSDEIGDLQGYSTIIAVGIGVDADTLGILDLIDSNGNAIDVQDPNDLDGTFQGTNPLLSLAAVGSDAIEGGAGDDIIFGDTMNTDALAEVQGLNLNQGSGWEVFALLEATNGWNRADTVEYISTHTDELAVESIGSNGQGRNGGHDTLNGGDGNDIIFGQEGNDVIIGGEGDDFISGGTGEDVIDAGAGNNTVNGGEGADLFILSTTGEGVTTVEDFNGSEGDALDITSVLIGYDPLTDALSDFVSVYEENGDTIVQINADGIGNDFETVAILEDLDNIDLNSMITDGTLLAA